MDPQEEATTTAERQALLVQVPAPDKPVVSISSSTASAWHLFIAAAGVSLVLGGIIYGGVQGIHNDISRIDMAEQLLAVRVSGIEEKDRYYDGLISRRNEQITSIEQDVAVIKEFVEEEKAREQKPVSPSSPQAAH